jgi:glutamate racemase
MIQSKAIGIFDSGLGGLTVMQQIMNALPNENLIYFGDTARVPYGEKSPETILRYSIENTEFLLQHQVKAIVIACNTATACALEELRHLYDIPLIGVIEPSVERAIAISRNHKIAVLGTRATINSGIYEREILKRSPQASVISIACPLLVPLVEENFIAHPATRMILKEYLRSLHLEDIDTVVLGCTHYPLLSHLIEDEVGSYRTVINSAAACAEKLRELLTFHQICNDKHEPSSQKFFVSDDPIKFQSLGKQFLGIPIEITKVSHTQYAHNSLACN